MEGVLIVLTSDLRVRILNNNYRYSGLRFEFRLDLDNVYKNASNAENRFLIHCMSLAEYLIMDKSRLRGFTSSFIRLVLV